MRKTWVAALGLLAVGMFSPLARGADHRDGSTVNKDAAVDITDLYTWMSADGSKVYLVLDIQGANTGATASTKFSNAALYVFRITSGAAVGATSMAKTIICSFDNAATQGFQCWGPSGEYVADAVGVTAGKTSTSGKMKVAAVVRDDPFSFNIRGFLALTATVKQLAGGLTFDGAKCPAIDSTTSGVAVNLLKSDGNMMPGKDDFGKDGKAAVACQHTPTMSSCDAAATTNGNILSIVVAIDKTLLTTNGNILGVWASTNKK